MNEHSEKLLARLVAGELEPTSAEVREQAERDPVFRDALAEAPHLREALARAGRERKDMIRSAKEEIGPRDVEAARAFVHASAKPVRRARGRWLGAALAASVATALLWVATRPEVPDGGAGPLGPTGTGDAFPVGRVSDVRYFQIPEELPVGGDARIQVYDNATPEDPVFVFESPLLDTRRWDLGDEEAAALPQQILWHYDLLDTTGEIPGRWFEAQLED